jgi:hypothetical protein
LQACSIAGDPVACVRRWVRGGVQVCGFVKALVRLY